MCRTASTLSLILLVLPCSNAQTASGERPGPKAGKSPSAVVDELRQSYKGATLLIQQKGIMGLPITNLAVAVANFENGSLRQPGWSERALNAERATWFQPGDRVIAEKFDVDLKRDRITFTLVTADRTAKAGLHFKFEKGFLARADSGQIYDIIGKVILFDNSGNAQQNPEQQAPPTPPQQQAPPAPPPQQPAVPAASAENSSVAPLMLDGKIVGYGPVGAVLLPPDQAPASADGRPWVPVMRDGKIAAYAPPGSVIFGASPSTAPADAPAASSSEPKTIRLGMTGEQVQAILGTPEKIANAGSKVIFIYKDLKVTLTDGKVTDVQ